MNWSPLGENAVLVWCTDERSADVLARAARGQDWPWLVDVVQAYASVAVFFDRSRGVAHAAIVGHLRSMPNDAAATKSVEQHIIPVCYERHLDLDRIAAVTGLDRDAIIQFHSEATYTVYAIGFCPGFPYLGYLSNEIAQVPRLPAPRLRIPVGSVGLTGRQTGIYTEVRPGGWNIVGQTPLELVNVADNYFPMRTGDEVRFERIDEGEYERLRGNRLCVARRND